MPPRKHSVPRHLVRRPKNTTVFLAPISRVMPDRNSSCSSSSRRQRAASSSQPVRIASPRLLPPVPLSVCVLCVHSPARAAPCRTAASRPAPGTASRSPSDPRRSLTQTRGARGRRDDRAHNTSGTRTSELHALSSGVVSNRSSGSRRSPSSARSPRRAGVSACALWLPDFCCR